MAEQDPSEEPVSIVDKFCAEVGFSDDTREKIRAFWKFFYHQYYSYMRTEQALLRDLFLRAAFYVGVAKGSPDSLKVQLPPGKSRGDVYREMQVQAGVCQEFYNTMNRDGVKDVNDTVEHKRIKEEEGNTGVNVGPELLKLLNDGAVDGSAATEDVPEVRESGSGAKEDTDADAGGSGTDPEPREVPPIISA